MLPKTLNTVNFTSYILSNKMKNLCSSSLFLLLWLTCLVDLCHSLPHNVPPATRMLQHRKHYFSSSLSYSSASKNQQSIQHRASLPLDKPNTRTGKFFSKCFTFYFQNKAVYSLGFPTLPSATPVMEH